MSDYISREAAYQFFKDQLEEETGAYRKGRNAGLRVAMSAVMNNDAIPAADVRPVRRGKWQSWDQDKPPCKWYSCDYCGYHSLNKSNYCPHCGADMRGESE